jgi:hypothetical protein
MARLPSNEFLIQQIGDYVILFEEGSEEEVVRILVNKNYAVNFAKAQKVIHDSTKLSDEDKSMAHFWCGYFYAAAAWNV